MKQVFLVLFAASFSFAAVPTDQTLTKGDVRMHIQKIDLGPGYFVGFTLHLQTQDPATRNFSALLRLRKADGTVTAEQVTIPRFPETRPGTFWSSVALRTEGIAEFISVTVEEVRAPKITDFH